MKKQPESSKDGTIVHRDPYLFRVRSADGKYFATQKLLSESYSWRVVDCSKNLNYAIKDSGVRPQVKDDSLELTWSGAGHISIEIRANTRWQHTMQGMGEMSQDYQSKPVTITLAIAPKE